MKIALLVVAALLIRGWSFFWIRKLIGVGWSHVLRLAARLGLVTYTDWLGLECPVRGGELIIVVVVYVYRPDNCLPSKCTHNRGMD